MRVSAVMWTFLQIQASVFPQRVATRKSNHSNYCETIIVEIVVNQTRPKASPSFCLLVGSRE